MLIILTLSVAFYCHWAECRGTSFLPFGQVLSRQNPLQLKVTNLCRVGGRVGGGVADVVVAAVAVAVAVTVAARLVTGAFSPVAATVDATAT